MKGIPLQPVGRSLQLCSLKVFFSNQQPLELTNFPQQPHQDTDIVVILQSVRGAIRTNTLWDFDPNTLVICIESEPGRLGRGVIKPHVS